MKSQNISMSSLWVLHLSLTLPDALIVRSGTDISMHSSLLCAYRSLSTQPFASKPRLSQTCTPETRRLFTTVQPHGELQILCDQLHRIPSSPHTNARRFQDQAGLDRYLDLLPTIAYHNKKHCQTTLSSTRRSTTRPLFLLKH